MPKNNMQSGYEYDSDHKLIVSVANLNAIREKYTRIDGKLPQVTFFLPEVVDADKLYSRDLQTIGIDEFNSERLGGAEGYQFASHNRTLIVSGAESLSKLAEAGVDFPAAHLFGPSPAKSHTKAVRGS